MKEPKVLIKGHNCPERNLKVLENNIIECLSENILHHSQDFINGMCFVYKTEKGMMTEEEFTIVMLDSMTSLLTKPVTDLQKGINYAINITKYDFEKDEGGLAALADWLPNLTISITLGDDGKTTFEVVEIAKGSEGVKGSEEIKGTTENDVHKQ
jgi:hypothetical protein